MDEAVHEVSVCDDAGAFSVVGEQVRLDSLGHGEGGGVEVGEDGGGHLDGKGDADEFQGVGEDADAAGLATEGDGMRPIDGNVLHEAGEITDPFPFGPIVFGAVGGEIEKLMFVGEGRELAAGDGDGSEIGPKGVGVQVEGKVGWKDAPVEVNGGGAAPEVEFGVGGAEVSGIDVPMDVRGEDKAIGKEDVAGAKDVGGADEEVEVGEGAVGEVLVGRSGKDGAFEGYGGNAVFLEVGGDLEELREEREVAMGEMGGGMFQGTGDRARGGTGRECGNEERDNGVGFGETQEAGPLAVRFRDGGKRRCVEDRAEHGKQESGVRGDVVRVIHAMGRQMGAGARYFRWREPAICRGCLQEYRIGSLRDKVSGDFG